jgi:AraC-like DNA-binding protein
MRSGDDEFATCHFSTDEHPTASRLAALREIIDRFLPAEIAPTSDRPIHAEGSLRLLPGLGVLSAYMCGLRLTRESEHIDDRDDRVCLCVVSSGRALIRRVDQEIVLEDGEGTLLSVRDVTTITYPEAARTLIVSLPAGTLRSRVDEIDAVLMRRLPRDCEALRLLTAYVGFIQKGIRLAADDLRRQAIAHVQDIVALAARSTTTQNQQAEPCGVPPARLRAVKKDIIDNLGRSDLSMDAVAARHGMTARHLRRLFASEATTFSDFVLKQRLERARRALIDPHRADTPISALAFECGFGDLSYFNRAFRRAYGAPPSDIRNGTRPDRIHDKRKIPL